MADPIVVERDIRGTPLPPADPDVKLPPAIAKTIALGAEAHKQAYTPQPAPQPDTNQPQAPVQPVPQTPPAPVPPAPAPQDPRANWTAEQWVQHARSMEGRYKQSQETITSLQGSMSELGDELIRAQAHMRQPVAPQPQANFQPAPVTPLLTKEDTETYGEDFLNVAQRAALQAVAPKLAALEADNLALKQQLRRQNVDHITTSLDREVPNWRQINSSPRWLAWLRLPDFYSGRVRQELLNQAHQAADAARVSRFFKGFLSEEEATGSTEFLPTQGQPPLPAAPRQPAVQLEMLAAPGHAKPAQGTQPSPANEPIWITHGQISKFYENVRKGVYAGREADKQNDEAIIFECQRTGRVR